MKTHKFEVDREKISADLGGPINEEAPGYGARGTLGAGSGVVPSV